MAKAASCSVWPHAELRCTCLLLGESGHGSRSRGSLSNKFEYALKSVAHFGL